MGLMDINHTVAVSCLFSDLEQKLSAWYVLCSKFADSFKLIFYQVFSLKHL